MRGFNYSLPLNENDWKHIWYRCFAYLLSSVGKQVQFPASVFVWLSHPFPFGPPGELLCFVIPAPVHLQSDKEKMLKCHFNIIYRCFYSLLPFSSALPDFHATVWGPLHFSLQSSHSWPSCPSWSGTGLDLWERQHPPAHLTGRSDSVAPSPPTGRTEEGRMKEINKTHSRLLTVDRM